MFVTICDVCDKRVDKSGLHINVYGRLELSGKSSYESHDKAICSECYIKFKEQFIKVFAPIVHKGTGSRK